MNPDEYKNVSLTEAEEMMYDPDYQCDIPRLVLNKILALPSKPQAAMALLSEQKELEAHRVLNLIHRGSSDETFGEQDFESGDPRGVLSQAAADKEEEEAAENADPDSQSRKLLDLGVKADHMSTASSTYDIFEREARRNRLRGMGPGNKFSRQEIEWRVMDRILAPHVYGIDESTLEPARNGADLVSSVVPYRPPRRPHLAGTLEPGGPYDHYGGEMVCDLFIKFLSCFYHVFIVF